MKIYSVEYINHYLKDLINNEFKYPIAIKGEMSDLNKSNAGHYYFTLSSGDASISCAFFVKIYYLSYLIFCLIQKKK